MSDQDNTEQVSDQVAVSVEALSTALSEMTTLYSNTVKDLVVHRAVIQEQFHRIKFLESQLEGLRAAATPGTIIQLDASSAEHVSSDPGKA